MSAGTGALLDALDLVSAHVRGGSGPGRRRATDYRAFLTGVDRAVPPGVRLLVICDTYAVHMTDIIQRWLAAHPRFRVEFTPTGSSWRDSVGQRLGGPAAAAVERRVDDAVAAVAAEVRDWTQSSDGRRPFAWTTKAAECRREAEPFRKRT